VTSTAPREWTFRAGRQRVVLETGRDFVASSGVASARAAIDDAELVFAGYGIEAPEYQWDDFKGVDLRGKVLLLLNDEPDWDPALFAGKRRLYYGRWTYKFESAARQGAVGAILLHTPASAGCPWQTVQTSQSGENSRLAEAAGGRGLEIEAWISEDGARRVATLAGRDLDALVAAARERSFRPVPLGVTTSLVLANEVRPYASANVAAVLRGGDPALRDEMVVYTAHHDHLGIKTSAQGVAEIYNGALDNAAGVAQLLAIARAFSALPEPPRQRLRPHHRPRRRRRGQVDHRRLSRQRRGGAGPLDHRRSLPRPRHVLSLGPTRESNLRARSARPSASEPGEKVPRGSAAWKRGTESPS